MSTPVLAVCFFALALAASLTAKLVRSAWRGRETPDVLIAVFFTTGIVGYAALILRRALPELSPAGDAGLSQLGLGGLMIPAVCIGFFTWVVFRPAESWARWTAWGLAAVIAGTHAWVHWIGPVEGGAAFGPDAGAAFWIGSLARGIAFAWAGTEALVYWNRARRRAALGLADPIVCNRFLLWAVWSGGAGAILLIRVVENVWFDGQNLAVSLPLPIVIGQLVAGSMCGVAIWLTFAPPAFYLRRVGAAAR